MEPHVLGAVQPAPTILPTSAIRTASMEPHVLGAVQRCLAPLSGLFDCASMEPHVLGAVQQKQAIAFVPY